MPVTAKLSRKFYEQFGDDITGELVDWFNAVDLTYQTQLKEINELNWERFKATLLAEGAAIRSELRGEMRAGFAELRTEIVGVREQLRGEMGGLRTEMATMRANLLRWMFIYWMGSVIGLGGLVFAALQSR